MKWFMDAVEENNDTDLAAKEELLQKETDALWVKNEKWPEM